MYHVVTNSSIEFLDKDRARFDPLHEYSCGISRDLPGALPGRQLPSDVSFFLFCVPMAVGNDPHETMERSTVQGLHRHQWHTKPSESSSDATVVEFECI